MWSGRHLLVVIVTCVVVPSAAAQNVGFLKDAPISRMNKEDMDLLVKNYQDALARLPDGETNTWRNPHTGHSGSATPIRTAKEQGTTCRIVQFKNEAGGFSGGGEFKFCRQGEGSWQLVN